MAITGTNAATANSPSIVAKDKTGFAGLTSDTFMKLLITQLQNQDPTEPVGNEELLNQLSIMRNLQSNIELGDALKAISSNQQLSNASAFIGKTVAGTDTTSATVSGVVDRAFLRDGEAFVGIGQAEVPFNNVTNVSRA